MKNILRWEPRLHKRLFSTVPVLDPLNLCRSAPSAAEPHAEPCRAMQSCFRYPSATRVTVRPLWEAETSARPLLQHVSPTKLLLPQDTGENGLKNMKNGNARNGTSALELSLPQAASCQASCEDPQVRTQPEVKREAFKRKRISQDELREIRVIRVLRFQGFLGLRGLRELRVLESERSERRIKGLSCLTLEFQ